MHSIFLQKACNIRQLLSPSHSRVSSCLWQSHTRSTRYCKLQTTFLGLYWLAPNKDVWPCFSVALTSTSSRINNSQASSTWPTFVSPQGVAFVTPVVCGFDISHYNVVMILEQCLHASTLPEEPMNDANGSAAIGLFRNQSSYHDHLH